MTVKYGERTILQAENMRENSQNFDLEAYIFIIHIVYWIILYD